MVESFSTKGLRGAAAFCFLLSSLLPASFAQDTSVELDGVGSYTQAVQIEEVEMLEEDEIPTAEEELLQDDYPLSPPTIEIQELRAEVTAVRGEIQTLYAELAQALIQAASMETDLHLDIVNVISNLAEEQVSQSSDSNGQGVRAFSGGIIFANSMMGASPSLAAFQQETLLVEIEELSPIQEVELEPLSGLSTGSTTNVVLEAENDEEESREIEIATELSETSESQEINLLEATMVGKVGASSIANIKKLIKLERAKEHEREDFKTKGRTVDELKVELEELEEERDDIKNLVKKVTQIIYTYLEEVRAQVKEKSERESRLRTRRSADSYRRALKDFDPAALTSSASLLNFQNQRFFSLVEEEDPVDHESIIDTVEMDMALAAIHTFLNPPKGTSPAHRLFLYMSQVDIQKQQQYMRTLSKIRKMNKLAEERDNLVIRVMGKEFPRGFPAMLLMGKNVLFELVEKNIKS